MSDRTPDPPIEALTPAAGYQVRPLFPGQRPGYKALIEFQGRMLIAYTLDALSGAASVGRILVVGPPPVLDAARAWPSVEGVNAGRSLITNLWRGIRAAEGERILICNSDQPLLRPEMIDEFVGSALKLDVDLVTSWVRLETLGSIEPRLSRKFAPFGDARYCHGNLFLVKRSLVRRRDLHRRVERLYSARKNNLKFAMALGPTILLRYLWAHWTGRLPTLAQVLEIAGKDFGLSMAPVISPHAEMVIDIDEAEDFEAAGIVASHRAGGVEGPPDGAHRNDSPLPRGRIGGFGP